MLKVTIYDVARHAGVSTAFHIGFCHIRLMEGEEQIPEMSLMPLRHRCSV